MGTLKSDPNAKPCFLVGHVWRLTSDGSRECLSCGLYHGPDPKTVAALLAINAGGKEYRRQAIALGLAAAMAPDGSPFLYLPKTPAPVTPKEPPLYVAADGSTELPSMWVVLTLAAAFGVGLGLIAWRILGGVLL
jgi:hypothetical protein